MTTSHTLYTIGHSNHPLEVFISLLARHKIDVLVDVRSKPYSRFCPHFNFRSLGQYLPAVGIEYRYLGKHLGGHPDDPSLYKPDGRVDYASLAASDLFTEGLDELENILTSGKRVAIMCAEADPNHCHRRFLVTPAMAARGAKVIHITKDAELIEETNLARPALDDAQLSLF